MKLFGKRRRHALGHAPSTSGILRSPRRDREIELRAAVGSVVEPLEQRNLFSSYCFGMVTWDCTQWIWSPYCSCDCPPKVATESSNGDGKAPAVKPETKNGAPVRYADGMPVIDTIDVSSDGFGKTWGQGRSYSSTLITGPMGNHWVVSDLPFLDQASSGALVEVASGSDQRFFYGDDTAGWSQQFLGGDSLVHATVGGDGFYVLTDTNGGVTTFDDFNEPDHPGQFESYRDPSGMLTYVTSHDADGQVLQVQRSDGTNTELWDYHYATITNGNSDAQEVIDNVKLRRNTGGGTNFATIQQVDYTYYDGTTAGGSLLDLAAATIKDGSGNVIDTKEYRYWKSGETATEPDPENPGYTTVVDQQAGTLKMVFDGAAIARMKGVNGSLDPTSSTDAQVASYANNYFTYYADNGHEEWYVCQEVAAGFGSSANGGLGTFTMTYLERGTPNTDFNTWIKKATVANPGGSTDVVYLNRGGEPMLKLTLDQSSNVVTGEFWKYDDMGRLIWDAQGSALRLPSDLTQIEQYDDLLHYFSDPWTGVNDYEFMNHHAGLINVTEYYTSTSGSIDETTAGGVTGYFKDSGVMQGDLGTLILKESKSYFAHSNGNGVSVHPVAVDTLYSVAGSTTTGARATKYSYAWSGTTSLQPISMMATQPPIVAAQNGPASSNTDTTNADKTTYYFDRFGRVIFQKDGGGYVTYTEYDDARGGAVKKTIADADTGQTGDFSVSVPSGLSSPGGTRLRVTTAYTYTVSGSKRTTQIADPNGNNTFIVYDDANREVRTYRGWHVVSGSGTNALYNTTGPVEINREYRPGSGVGSNSAIVYQEYLTATILPHTGNPTGSENFSSGGTVGGSVQTLSRDISNNAGQVVESDRYVNFGTNSYSTSPRFGTSGTTYYATAYGFNNAGALNRIQAPTGTITNLVFDARGRLTSTWVGTNDQAGSSTNTAYWTPTNQGTNANMVDVQDNYYDTYKLNPTVAPTLSQTSGTGTDTNMYYDVAISYVTGAGETPVSPPDTLYVDDNNQLIVSSPSGLPAMVTGYNVYMISPIDLQWRKQNATPIAIGTNWTMPDATGIVDYGLAPGALLGDGNLTRAVQHPGASAADRVNEYYYDWRDRAVSAKQGVTLDADGRALASAEDTDTHRLLTYNVYDNLDEATQTDKYAADQVGVTYTSGVPDAPSSSKLRARVTFSYDDQGRAFRSDTFSVTPNGTSAATVGTNTLSSQTWFDHRGNVMASAQPGGLVSKFAYDGAGRVIRQYTTDGGQLNAPSTWRNWTNVASLANDVILQQVETDRDANGNATLIVMRQRFHDDATNGAGLGSLADPSNNPKARVSYSAFWYDKADRLTDSVDVGTNGGASYTRDPDPPAATNRSDVLLLNHVDYNEAGWTSVTTDPKGHKALTLYDMLGRATRTVSAWDGSTNALSINVSGSSVIGINFNQTTEYTYDGDDHVLTMKAWNKAGDTNSSVVTFQTTQYNYAARQTNGSGIDSNDILTSVQYPDKSTGNPGSGTANTVAYTFNALGQVKTSTDRNGTTLAYAYDVLGRKTSDIVTAYDANVIDSTTLSIFFEYDTAGRRYQQTSHSGTTAATFTTSQSRQEYNGLGQLIKESEAPNSVITTNTASVQYTYAEMSGGINSSRMTSMIYPNGRVLHYEYSGNDGIDNAISRVSYLADDDGSGAIGTHLEEYKYLGLGTIIEMKRPEVSQKLSYVQQTGDTLHGSDGGDQYTGLDRFGRIVDQWWMTYSGTAVTGTVDRFQFGYDRNSNVLHRNNLGPGTAAASFSELYHINSTSSGDDKDGYDALDRLTGFRRGTLSSSGNNGTSFDTVTTLNSNTNVAGSQAWSLDALGNQSAVTTNGTTQSNTTDQQNELTNFAGTALTYDGNGSLATDDFGHNLWYDAWGRLKEVDDYTGVSPTFTFYYYCGDSQLAGEMELFGYNANWFYDQQGRVIEERSRAAGTESNQYVWGLSYVNDLIIRDRDTDESSSTGAYGKRATSGTNSTGFDERIYAQHDANHNVTSIVNGSDGSVAERFVYDSYGKLTTLSSTWANASNSKDWTVLFQGGRYDPRIGLYTFGARQYSPTLGRWVEQEPFGARYLDGANLYTFEHGNPSVNLDPSGLSPIGVNDASQAGAVLTPFGWPVQPPPITQLPIRPTIPLERVAQALWMLRNLRTIPGVDSLIPKLCNAVSVKLGAHRAGFAGVHTYISIETPTGVRLGTISGEPDINPGFPGLVGGWGLTAYRPDAALDLFDGTTATIPITTGAMCVEDFIIAADLQAQLLDRTETYHMDYHNSNWFAEGVITGSGGTTSFPWNALGSDPLDIDLSNWDPNAPGNGDGPFMRQFP